MSAIMLSVGMCINCKDCVAGVVVAGIKVFGPSIVEVGARVCQCNGTLVIREDGCSVWLVESQGLDELVDVNCLFNNVRGGNVFCVSRGEGYNRLCL